MKIFHPLISIQRWLEKRHWYVKKEKKVEKDPPPNHTPGLPHHRKQ